MRRLYITILASLLGTIGPLPVLAGNDDAIQANSIPPGNAFANSETKWSLRLPQEAQVSYHGLVNYDNAGMSSGPMTYPAPNVAGFVAAIITHAIIVDSVKKAQKDKLQTAADNVLSPYKEVMETFTFSDLVRRAIPKLPTGLHTRFLESSLDPAREIVVESAPVFYHTQDRQAIIIENLVAIHVPGNGPESDYKATVRVVSTPIADGDAIVEQTANNGEKLKDVSAKLFAESFEIAFRDAHDTSDKEKFPQRSIRYREGGIEKIERAQVLSSQCNRLLIRTLRGVLLSVPIQPTSTGTNEACTTPG